VKSIDRSILQKKGILQASRAFLYQAKSAVADGVWRTTDDGNKIFIEGNGDVRVGGPNGRVISSVRPKKKPTARKPRKKKEVDPKKPYVPKTQVDKAIVEYVGDDRATVEAFKPFVDETHKMLFEKYQGDRNSLQEVLGAFGMSGSKAAGWVGALRFKDDYTEIPGFDEMAEYAARYHPELLATEQGEAFSGKDIEQAFFNRLQDGFPQTPGKYSEEVMNLAAQMAGPGFFGDSILSEYDRQLEREMADVVF